MTGPVAGEPVVDEPIQLSGAIAVMRRGLADSPAFVRGLRLTAGLAVLTAVGRLALPILIQQVLDRGFADGALDLGAVYRLCGVAVAVMVGVWFLARATRWRLVQASEDMLHDMRDRAFAHVHRLSLADHTESRRGELTARVTSDIDTIAQFTEWGGVAWIVNTVLILGTVVVMAIYSWALALVVVIVFAPLLPLLRVLQRRQLKAYDRVRGAVGSAMGEFSEVVAGAPTLKAYGAAPAARRRLTSAIDEQYAAELSAAKFFAFIFVTGDVNSAIALGAVVGVGAAWGPELGLSAGELVGFVFLVQLLLGPIAELGEVLDRTQTAVSGWRRVLDLLDRPIEVAEVVSGQPLPEGPLSVEVDGLGFSYREGPPVLVGVGFALPAGASLAVVGETGSGKSTLAKILCRLADPSRGRVEVGGVPLDELDSTERLARIRMVPQDGFLFSGTIAENVRLGRPGASDGDVAAAFWTLDLHEWLASLPDGIDTDVGERGSNLSVGERQLVALARASLADPGLLILDEATSNLDPETEQALQVALERLAEGRTLISIAHRLSTAERADLVAVMDSGELKEFGPHGDLVAAGGLYTALHDSWVGNTSA